MMALNVFNQSNYVYYVLGLVSRLKYIVSNRARNAPCTAGLGYGEFIFVRAWH